MTAPHGSPPPEPYRAFNESWTQPGGFAHQPGLEEEADRQLFARAADAGGAFACQLDTPSLPDDTDSCLVRAKAWGSGRPNPLPQLSRPDHFYTPIILPTVYYPFAVPPPHNVAPYLYYYPIQSERIIDLLRVFLLHEGIHDILLGGIIPCVIRLAAAQAYQIIAHLVRQGFDQDGWIALSNYNAFIKHTSMAIAPIHESVAIVSTWSRFTRSLPNVKLISFASARRYTKQFNWYIAGSGDTFEQLFLAMADLNNNLIDKFEPNPVQTTALHLLFEYAISSVLQLEYIEQFVLNRPDKISVEDHLTGYGLLYGDPSGGPLILQLPSLSGKLSHVTRRLESACHAIISAEKPSYQAQSIVDQVRYFSSIVPDFYEWLENGMILRWLRSRSIDAMREAQYKLGLMGFSLPLVDAWDPSSKKVTPLTILSGGYPFDRSETMVTRTKISFAEKELLESLPVDRGLLYYLPPERQEGMILGPYTSVETTRPPVRPSALILDRHSDGAERDKPGPVSTLLVMESIRQQIASGRGVGCPLYRDDGRCCGHSSLVWAAYEAGRAARSLQRGGDKAKEWWAPECSRES